MKRSSSLSWLFFIGLFSETQIRIVGSIGISELVVYFVAPFVFCHDILSLKHDRFMPAINLALMAMAGCVISSFYNRIPLAYALRGFATTYSLFAWPVVLHHFLRNNYRDIRWLFLGVAISGIITIFFFHNGAEYYQYMRSATGAESGGMIKGGQLFVLSHFGAWVTLPLRGWYYQTPFAFCVISPLILTIYTIVTTATGRSAILLALLSSTIVFMGGKSRLKMRTLQRRLPLLLILGTLMAIGVASLYKYAGQKGLLNKEAQQKYENQIAKRDVGGGPLKLLMAGRVEFFVGLYGCLTSPIMGKGPWAIDTDRIYERFLEKYGNARDYDGYMQMQRSMVRSYGRESEHIIPAHSHIIGFWLGYGILGLPYWLYVLWLMYRHYRFHLTVIPQWFGVFALSGIDMLWGIFFSPYGARLGGCLFVVMLLFARAVATGRLNLPLDMEMEARRYD